MRILAQRVKHARVDVDGDTIGAIGSGLLLLVGIGQGDTPALLEPMAAKILNLRIFPDEADKMNRSILDCAGEILAVSQFTLHADCRKGRRPSFIRAAPPEIAAKLFDDFVAALRSAGVKTETGRFGAMMDVHLLNWGPVTIWLDSEEVLPK